jgi:choice-of-anchor A domain-containing protein
MGSAANPYASDSEGPVAVGGNAYFQDFTVAAVTNHGVNALTVGGNLSQLRAQDGGNVFVGGNADFHDGQQGGATIFGTLTVDGTLIHPPTQFVGVPQHGPDPINFASVHSALTAASALLASPNFGRFQTGQVVYQDQFNQKELDLNGSDPSLDVFNVSGALLGQIGGVQQDYSDGGGSLHINIPNGATAIINIDGSVVNFGHPGNFGFFCDGVVCTDQDSSRILFNFYQATQLDMESVDGSILAPFADVTYTNGEMLGGLIADSLGGPLYTTGEFHDVPFAGTFAVPAPSAASLALVGFGLLLQGHRRRARAVRRCS